MSTHGMVPKISPSIVRKVCIVDVVVMAMIIIIESDPLGQVCLFDWCKNVMDRGNASVFFH